MKESVLHTVRFSGSLVFESNHPNFRKALSDYLSHPEQGGVQLRVTNIDGTERDYEDVVVDMTLIKMKQHPDQHQFKKRKIAQKVDASPGFVVETIDKGPVDTCFY